MGVLEQFRLDDRVAIVTGGARGLEESDLERAYHSSLDPRLNYEQAIELAMFVGREIRSFGRP